MKKILFLLTFATSHYLASTTEDTVAKNKNLGQEFADFDTHMNEDELADNTGIIRVSFLIYKDQGGHNKQGWKHLVTRTIESCDKFRSYELQEDSTINIQQEVQAIVNDLITSNDDNGIITEFTIQTSDGIPPKGCCGDNCQCFQRYRGNCPCSLDSSLNRCLFPQEELPFDDRYEEDESESDDSTSEDTTDNDNSASEDTSEEFEEIDLNASGTINKNKKGCCCK